MCALSIFIHLLLFPIIIIIIYKHAEVTAVVAEKDAVIEKLQAQLAKRDASAVATSELLILVRTLYMIMTLCLPIILSYTIHNFCSYANIILIK